MPESENLFFSLYVMVDGDNVDRIIAAARECDYDGPMTLKNAIAVLVNNGKLDTLAGSGHNGGWECRPSSGWDSGPADNADSVKLPKLLGRDDFMAQHGTPDDDTDDQRFDGDIAWKHYWYYPQRWKHPVDDDGLDPVGQMITSPGPWWHADAEEPAPVAPKSDPAPDESDDDARAAATALMHDANARDYTSRDIWCGEGPADLQERFRALSNKAAEYLAYLAYSDGNNDWRAEAGLPAPADVTPEPDPAPAVSDATKAAFLLAADAMNRFAMLAHADPAVSPELSAKINDWQQDLSTCDWPIVGYDTADPPRQHEYHEGPVSGVFAESAVEGNTRIARWESTSGKHWVNLVASGAGYSYDSPGLTGFLGNIGEQAAIEEMQRRVDDGLFQPDDNKTPMTMVEMPDPFTDED